MCFQEKSYNCYICTGSLHTSGCLVTPCGHIYHRTCILNRMATNKFCPTCRRMLQVSSLSRAFLTDSNNTKSSPSLEKVIEKSEVFQHRLDTIKERIDQYDQDTEGAMVDLKDILETLDVEIGLFEEMKDINCELELALNNRSKLLEKNFAKKRLQYEQMTSSSLDQTEKIDEMAKDIRDETESAQQYRAKKLKEWKSYLLDLLETNRNRCELSTKIGNQPRRYIKESFENHIKCLDEI